MHQEKKKKVPSMSVPLAEARGPFVLGLDVGSTASRGGLYDATGRPVKGSKERIAHEFTTAPDGTSIIDADQVAEECREVVEGIVAFARKKGLEVSGVALDSFASSLVAVDAAGQALTPAITYADSRCAPFVAQARELVDERSYHQRTGVRLHTSYFPARLLWLRETQPEVWEKLAHVMSIGEYVYHRLAGITGMATSLAAWSGIIEFATGELDRTTLDALGVPAELFAEIFDPDEPAYPTASPWEELNGIAWFYPISDGWPSNVGPGATDEHTVAVAAATSGAMRVIVDTCPEHVDPGLWCYRLSSSRWIVGGALNDVGRAVSWMERVLAEVDAGELARALGERPRQHVPDVLPFFSGERATGWAADAKAALWNVTDDTTVLDIWRGVFEAIAHSYRRVWQAMAAAPQRVVVSGRVATDHPTWLAILADTLATPVVPLEMKRATLRGTALIALGVLDPAGRRATPPFGAEFAPRLDDDTQGYYQGLAERFDRGYAALVG
ncbi:gluconate kinase [Corynebacterium atypicum]|uniref:Gluconate kinase n=1 Tax=Corynebacterium atypicum TaxID=191610 RepID=A0ABM5QQ80_9CORY|nr:gluconokinase [Corynebacterium atypicum]AIG64871.1 gluconate kinase [Corynebacterium atypicum]